MTLNDAIIQTNAIKKAAEEGDFETAHMLEDKLRLQVLEFIVTGAYPHLYHSLAGIAVSTKFIKFKRVMS